MLFIAGEDREIRYAPAISRGYRFMRFSAGSSAVCLSSRRVAFDRYLFFFFVHIDMQRCNLSVLLESFGYYIYTRCCII